MTAWDTGFLPESRTWIYWLEKSDKPDEVNCAKGRAVISIRAVKDGCEGPAPQPTLGGLQPWARKRAPGTTSNSCVKQQSEPTLRVPIQPCAVPDTDVGATRDVGA